mmetsp:Transcript_28853/g.41112  ORF Transcript_28853/g.41112 Transcript_28853/m.41112 type:complete len:466 (+) Transcript_28853:20-1417(+)
MITVDDFPADIMEKMRKITLSILRETAKESDLKEERPEITVLNLRRSVMTSKIGSETVKTRLCQIKNERGITSSKYKKRAFKEVIKTLEDKNLIKLSNDIDNDSIVALNINEINKDIATKPNDVTLLLFYAYCPTQMTRAEQDKAIELCYKRLTSLNVTGRLRVAREGYNSTLTGSYSGIRDFTSWLRKEFPDTFQHTDFKYVDELPANHKLKGLKVWPVTEIVTYGFDPADAPLEKTGTHLSPVEFHKAMMNQNSIMIDVRNFNETLIGKFAPPTHSTSEEIESNSEKKKSKKRKADSEEVQVPKVLDPCMRKSTEFPEWVEQNKELLQGKQVLMYCTGGVRCERASAYLRNRGGIEDVYQLEGGIHRYLEAFPQDGGFWVGKNYTFDKRFSHGAENATVISTCVHCGSPWDRYQAQKVCANSRCGMEVLLCRPCERTKPAIAKDTLFCPLCSDKKKDKQTKRN